LFGIGIVLDFVQGFPDHRRGDADLYDVLRLGVGVYVGATYIVADDGRFHRAVIFSRCGFLRRLLNVWMTEARDIPTIDGVILIL
jgi:hypothetical protein